MIKNYTLSKKTRDSYFELVLRFPLASIKSRAHFDHAQKVIDQLIAQGKLDEGEELYLDALTDLVGTYEDAHFSIEPASDADLLRHFLEAKGVTQAQLSKETGVPKHRSRKCWRARRPLAGR